MPISVEGGVTDFLRASLRAFSLLSRSPTGGSSTFLSDCTLPSISLICSALSAFCYKKLLTLNRTRHLKRSHIVVFYEDRKGTDDCLEWQKHIGGCVGDINGNLRCFICRPPPRLFGRFRGGFGRWPSRRRRLCPLKATHSGARTTKCGSTLLLDVGCCG